MPPGKSDTVPHDRNPRTLEAETGGLTRIQSQSGLHSAFKTSINRIGRPYLKKTKLSIIIS